MRESFIKKYRAEFQYLVLSAAGIGIVAYALIYVATISVPHLPLANKRTFYGLLRAQMAVDLSAKLPAQKREMVLFLGSSVVERGVSERAMDSVFAKDHTPFETMNAGTGGFSAEANLPMFRAMLDQGLKPTCVVYGVCIQEFNRVSTVHAFFETKDTATIKLKSKTLWNILRYGPTALAPLLAADHLHQYLFAANNAFRDVPNLNLFDRMMFGENHPPLDSDYQFSSVYYQDLREIVRLCKEHGIQVALYNAPLRQRAPGEVDIPYEHRAESYGAALALAREMNIPLWNFDHKGFFTRDEFQDNYHLTPIGARRISVMLGDSIVRWRQGSISRDEVETLE
ncbi:MAG: hypothetical protein Q8922_08860 [Bacteroidota bacterium]|nr:hypothetical protein [Bacteroidota bacterium]MDP4234327.1 hypothetical protein [Bacteroidota bacterium]MDP4243261.1 hypothetical protein [Bacteroidota bacterium]MDP4288032.1 hypothetical protein [Bacteroidota bacterium]